MNNFFIKNNIERILNLYCSNRDKSHGIEHAKAVTSNALWISKNYDIEDEYVYVTAMLHDLADHKYDVEMDVVYQCLYDIYEDKDICNKICDVIKCISFSTEKKNGKGWYKDYLEKKYPQDYQILIELRNIVSDADKLEAIGRIGIDRCIEYSKKHLKIEKEEEIIKEVKKHCQEKLFKIYEEYLMTPIGKEKGLIKYQEMKYYLSNIKL